MGILGAVIGTEARLGEWQSHGEYGATLRKQAELRAQRAGLEADLQAALEEQQPLENALRDARGKQLIGEASTRDVQAAEKALRGYEERTRAARTELEALDTALATIEARLPDLETEARRAHVREVIRPWYEEHLTRLVRLMDEAAEVNTAMRAGIHTIREGFPDNWEVRDQYKPVNSYNDGRPVLDFSWADLVIPSKHVDRSTAYSRWRAKVREQAGK